MSALHSVESKLAAAWPPEAWRDVAVLLAISGGADSVALLRAMTALKTEGPGRLYAAHFNHHLRGDESAADEAFVLNLCRRIGLPCEVGSAPAGQLTAEGGQGLEAAARAARYEFLRQTAARLGARYVATAHTVDDQVETILHRILRGTGIAGLAGMARARPLGPAATLIRPLLGFHRRELLVYLDDLEETHRSDSSNLDLRFTRNRIRHDLLPQLAERFNPNVANALLRLGNLAEEVQAVVTGIVDDLAERFATSESADVVQIDASALDTQPRYVVRELLMAVWRKQGWPMQAMGFAQWDALAEMISTCGGMPADAPSKQTFPGSVLAEAAERHLTLTRSASESTPASPRRC